MATLLFENGQTTARTIEAAERTGKALGQVVTVLSCWRLQSPLEENR
ncbi:hypothetical protein [Labrys monachus]|uniref:Uncharacterized protein n=1 Tax=Labrys monachus TaxID=217067 RepID=A0ABU0F9Y6_9HYPH|nr:hypothetical protein [Labrys monachus]MDQ0390888.1 hypothetical protein [Labrys monachus]